MDLFVPWTPRAAGGRQGETREVKSSDSRGLGPVCLLGGGLPGGRAHSVLPSVGTGLLLW